MKRAQVVHPSLEAKAESETEALGKRDSAQQPVTESACQLSLRRALFNTEYVDSLASLSGVFFKEGVFDSLCKCDACLKLYKTTDPTEAFLSNKEARDEYYEKALSRVEEPCPENILKRAENADLEFLSYMGGKFKERTGRDISPHEKLIMTDHYSKLKEQLGNLILGSGKNEISEEDMKLFLDQLKYNK